MKSCLLFVYVTFPNKKVALKSAQNLLNKKLIACANIIGKINSLYEWQGKLQNDNEFAVIFKTTQSRYKQLEAEIKRTHPYECPCIVALPISEAQKSYIKWVQDSLM